MDITKLGEIMLQEKTRLEKAEEEYLDIIKRRWLFENDLEFYKQVIILNPSKPDIIDKEFIENRVKELAELDTLALEAAKRINQIKKENKE